MAVHLIWTSISRVTRCDLRDRSRRRSEVAQVPMIQRITSLAAQSSQTERATRFALVGGIGRCLASKAVSSCCCVTILRGLFSRFLRTSSIVIWILHSVDLHVLVARGFCTTRPTSESEVLRMPSKGHLRVDDCSSLCAPCSGIQHGRHSASAPLRAEPHSWGSDSSLRASSFLGRH